MGSMDKWIDRQHPQTLQAAVFLGYLNAVFAIIAGGGSFFLLVLSLGLGAGAFVTANSKRWGYYLLAVCAVLLAVIHAYNVLVWISALAGINLDFLGFNILPISVSSVLGGLPFGTIAIGTLRLVNRAIFPLALAAVAVHRMSRDYQKIWFE